MTNAEILKLAETCGKDLMSCYIDNSGLFRQSEENSKRVNQKVLSYKQLIPSEDFQCYEYLLYLEYASVVELERDIVNERTYRCISTHDNWDDDEEIVDDKIRVKYPRLKDT